MSAAKKPVGLSWKLITASALIIAAIKAIQYMSLDPRRSGVRLDPAIPYHFTTLLLHVWPSLLALAIGPFQFFGEFRRRHRTLHRQLGRFYLLSVLIGGIGGLGAAMFSVGGPMVHIGFTIVGVLWLSSGFIAYRSIRRGQIGDHRIWMIRNYALTFSAVVIRLGGTALFFLLLRIMLMFHADDSALFATLLQSAPLILTATNSVMVEWFVIPRMNIHRDEH